MATEQQIQKKVFDYLVSEGCYVVKVISASKAGVQDITGCYEGVFFSIEVKPPSTSGDMFSNCAVVIPFKVFF